jgi:hypothetical protein
MILPKPAKALPEFHRVLVPGEAAMFTTWASQELNPLVIVAVCKSKDTEKKDIPWAKGCGDLEFCKEQLQSAGFRERRAVPANAVFRFGDIDGFVGSIARNHAGARKK